jgi:uncharacterized membrane protein
MNFTKYNNIAGQKLQRIEALSDGVFAICLTLLVLDIKVPISEAIKTESELIHSFILLTPKFLAYVLSFMTLGIFWVGHSTQLQFIDKSDKNVNWINLFFLLFVSLLPFTTAFLSEYIEFKFVILVYWLNLFLMGVFVYINWKYAYKKNYLSLPEDEAQHTNKLISQRIITAQALYAFGALLCFINTYLSIAVIIMIQFNFAFGIISQKLLSKKQIGN